MNKTLIDIIQLFKLIFKKILISTKLKKINIYDHIIMDLNLLKTFYEVAKQLSFTKASKKLYITQPAVTSQIKALEESFGGITLFKKSGGRSLLPTKGKPS